MLANPTDIVCAGIGENGHLAFNDPPVADFLDPVLVKVVRLDAACRNQQLNDGCFERLTDVPDPCLYLDDPRALACAGGLGGRARPTQGQRGADHTARTDQRVVPGHGIAAPPGCQALPRSRVGPARALISSCSQVDRLISLAVTRRRRYSSGGRSASFRLHTEFRSPRGSHPCSVDNLPV